MTTTQTPEHPERADLADIQGNLVGFNKDHQRLVYLRLPDESAGRVFLGQLLPMLANAWEVRQFNALYKELHGRGAPRGTIEATWLNVAFSHAGLGMLGVDGLDALPEDFRLGMAQRAALLGDVDNSDPQQWKAPFTGGEQRVHALVIIAADAPEGLEAAYQRLQGVMASNGVIELDDHQNGDVRAGTERGHEHFGFKDGISQPGISWVTQSSKHPADQIAAGEFLVGYPDEDGHISGQPGTPPPPAPPDPNGYNPVQPPPSPQPWPSWLRNGSFLVYRRLRQDVAAFKQAMVQHAAEAELSAEQLGAKLVGRWPSGAPLEHVPAEPADLDPTAADPADQYPAVLDDENINNFRYQRHDPTGSCVPRAAHIRKVNPRDQDPPGLPETRRHRLLRRGIPYGPEFDPTEPAYGTDPVLDERDRGLLLICYQSSITRGFEFVQSQWANQADFPQTGDGEDAIISQDHADRPFTLPPEHNLTFDRWVTTTGGDYFFAPSMDAIRSWANPAAIVANLA